MVALGEMTVEEAAEKAAGNWQDFTCFWWIRGHRLVGIPLPGTDPLTQNTDQ